jgi:hypothetical protein
LLSVDVEAKRYQLVQSFGTNYKVEFTWQF